LDKTNRKFPICQAILENFLGKMLIRIKQYLDHRGISVAQFERQIGMSNASFGKSLKTGGTIGADKIEKILREYPEINPIWLVTGKGQMMKSYTDVEASNASEPDEIYGIKSDDKKLKDEIINLQRKRITDLELIDLLKDRISNLEKEIFSLKNTLS